MANPLLGALVDRLVLPAVLSPNPTIRNAGILSMGTCGLLFKSPQAQHLALLLNVLKNDQEALQRTALLALFDLLLCYGSSSFKGLLSGEEGADAMSYGTLLESLLPYLTHQSTELRTIAVEGFARLMLFSRVERYAIRVLSQMTLLYFNPTTAEDLKLRQCLSVFFPSFAKLPIASKVLEQTALSVISAIMKAPSKSPVSEISILEAVRFVLIFVEEALTQERIAIAIANVILSAPESKHVKALCKCLLQAAFVTPNGISSMLVLSESILGVCCTLGNACASC